MAYRVIKEFGNHPLGTIINDETYAAVILAMYEKPHLELVVDEIVAAQHVVDEVAVPQFFGSKKKGR